MPNYRVERFKVHHDGTVVLLHPQASGAHAHGTVVARIEAWVLRTGHRAIEDALNSAMITADKLDPRIGIPDRCDGCGADTDALHQREDIPVQGSRRAAWLCDGCNASPGGAIST